MNVEDNAMDDGKEEEQWGRGQGGGEREEMHKKMEWPRGETMENG